MAPKRKKHPMKPLDFWEAFEESGAAARFAQETEALRERVAPHAVGEAQIDAIFYACLSRSNTLQILTEKARAELKET